MSSHERLAELAAEYALSALEPEEHREFEAHVAECDMCMRRVAELRSVTDTIAIGADQLEPPPYLKQRILTAIGETPSAPSLNLFHSFKAGATLWRAVTRPLAVAGAVTILLASVAGLSFWVTRLQDSASTSAFHVATAYDGIAIIAQAERRWDLEPTDLAPGASGFLAYSSDHAAACLVVFGLQGSEDGTYSVRTVSDQEHSPVGALWPIDDALWIIVRDDVTRFDAVEVTLTALGRTMGSQAPVVATVHLTLP